VRDFLALEGWIEREWGHWQEWRMNPFLIGKFGLFIRNLIICNLIAPWMLFSQEIRIEQDLVSVERNFF